MHVLIIGHVIGIFFHGVKICGLTYNCIVPVANGEMFTLSVRRQEYLMKAIFYGLWCSAVGRTLYNRLLDYSPSRQLAL